jgi:hypothetical protein
MSNMAGVLLEAGTTYHSRTPGFTPGIWWGSCLSFESTWVHPRYLVGFVFIIREHLGSPPVFGGVRVVHRFSFLCCVFCFVCLGPVSCIPNVASFSGLSIFDCPFDFLY